MKPLLNLPLKRKLLLITLATCMPALALACGALFWFQSATFGRAFSAELKSLGAMIAHYSVAPLTFDDKKSGAEVLAALKAKPHITSALVFDAEGKLFVSMGDGQGATKLLRGQMPADGLVIEDGYANLTLPIPLQEGQQGRLELRARLKDQYRELFSLYVVTLVAIFGGSLAVILLTSARLQEIITEPILALATASGRVSELEDYTTRVPEGGKDEVGLLTRTFNQMLRQIQERDQRLRESQERFEIAVMGSSDGLWDWNLVTNSIYLSPRWKAMLGYTDAELQNNLESIKSLLHPEEKQEVIERVQAYLAGSGGAFEIEFRAQHKDGLYRWILSRGVALRDARHKPIRFAGSHTDITERKRAEEEIRQSRRKFQSLVNSINGIVWEADPVTLMPLFISEQVEEILGFSPERCLDDHAIWSQLIHPEDSAARIKTHQEGVAGGKPYQLEYRAIAADRRVVWIRESVSVERENNRPVRLRAVALDITEQKIAEEQIARMQRELVDASRLAGKAEVATGVLHNVGNVLNSVNVSATLVAERLRKSRVHRLESAAKLLKQHQGNISDFLESDPKGKQLPAFFEALSQTLLNEQTLLSQEVKGIQQNVEHIKQIVSAQQSFARISGAVEPIDVRELVEDALNMVLSSSSSHPVEVTREFQAAPNAMADRHKVLQILVNLINNAKQAMETCHPRKLNLRVRLSDEGLVRIEVQDNGVGIPPENLTRIFRLGFTTKKGGHGFGLHSCANSAAEMGGALRVQSDGEGSGATFILDLPRFQTNGERNETQIRHRFAWNI